jgi:uncharacterized damage-inducible protein DinB
MSDRFDKFTERARMVLQFAQDEAYRFSHSYIGTEHILLGLVREGDGVAAQVLRNLGIELYKVRSAVEFIIGRGDRRVTGDIGLTPRAKRVIELAVEEGRRLGHHYIGTEHLLLGIISEGEGIAAGVLESLGMSLEKVRNSVVDIVGSKNAGVPSEEYSKARWALGNPGAARILLMFDYSKWARDKILGAMESLTDEQARDAEHKGVYGSIHDTLAHMAVSEWLWLRRCQGESPLNLPKGSDYPHIPAIIEWWDGVHEEGLQYLRGLHDYRLEEKITYTAPDGKTRTREVWQMLTQVTNHQTEHRAQIATMLGALGVEVPGTDLVVYLSEVGGQ